MSRFQPSDGEILEAHVTLIFKIEDRCLKNIVPAELYDRDDTGYWRRLSWVAGIGFGVPMGLMFFALFPTGSVSVRVFVGMSMGGISGVLFSRFFPGRLRRRMHSLTQAVYAGDPDLISQPPAGDLAYRLPCSWMKTDSFGVGGVLYIGSEEVVFVPHKRNLEGDQSPFVIGTPDQLHLGLVQPKRPNLLLRILVPRPVRYLQIESEHAQMRFLIPDPEHVIEALTSCLQEVKRPN